MISLLAFLVLDFLDRNFEQEEREETESEGRDPKRLPKFASWHDHPFSPPPDIVFSLHHALFFLSVPSAPSCEKKAS